ncbi:MAG TPA: hypothetical protein VK191_08625, partial [Symbiobacteriaceae bacterium]|nr:hypothetical protein [Symbiobacteriaceae bacterium]
MRVPRGLLIGRARLAGRLAGDAGAHRLRLTHLLERVETRPPGRPPSAILLVRSLGSLPGGSELGPLSGPGSGRLESALQARLAESWAKALRPRQGQVPPGVTEIWFLDEAEFLAFLALGRRDRWWWEALPDPGGLFPLLAGRPEALPGALLHLIEWGEAGRVLTQLSLPEARRLLDQLRSTFRLPVPTGPALESSRSVWTAPAPWEPVALTPSLLQRLGPERGQLLRMAVAVLRAPAVLRRWGEVVLAEARPAPSIREDEPEQMERLGATPAAVGPEPAAQRRSGEPVQPTQLPEPLRSSQVVDPVQPTALDHSAAPADRIDPTRRSGSIEPPRSAGRPASQASVPQATWQERPGQQAAPGAQPPFAVAPGGTAQTDRPPGAESGRGAPSETAEQAPQPAVGSPRVHGQPEAPTVSSTQLEPIATAESSAPRRAERSPDQPIQTALGGVLYLLNLLAHHDLPQRDEPTWRLASGLGAGGLLRILAGPLLPETGRDPLWALLAELDGTDPDQPLGAGLVQPPETSPAACLAPWFAPSGDSIQTLFGQPLAPALRAWMRQGLPPLLTTLTAAIGEPADRLAPYLRLPGRLWLTQTHLDLELSVDQIALPIRLAGLDA